MSRNKNILREVGNLKKMILSKLYLISLLFLFFDQPNVLAQDQNRTNKEGEKRTYKILLLGNSYFNYNNLMYLFETLATRAGKDVYVDQYVHNGFSLSDHCDNSETESKIQEEDWDFVVMIGSGSRTAYPNHFTQDPVYPALVCLKDKILKNHASTRMMFCMPWAYEDGMTWYGWGDTFADMQLNIYLNTVKYSEDIDFSIVPVGWVWFWVLEEKDYPLHYLHTEDWNHPSLKGSYLMACTIFTSIFQESVTNMQYTAGIQQDEALLFQTFATNVVLNDLELWNLDPVVLDVDNSLSSNHKLYQNYPNPFSGNTRIEYELDKAGFVTIAVYDVYGKKCTTLVNDYLLPGKYSTQISGDKLPAGVYYYVMKVGDFQQSKKMLVLK